MGSGVLFWGAAAFALVASGAAHSADLHPAMKVALWSWTGGYIGVHGGGGHGRTSFSDPYGPSIHGDIVNTPVFLAGGQIGYNWQTNGRVFGAELEASHAVSDSTNSCLAFSGNVVIATCKPGPNVFVSGTARVGYAFGPQGRSYVKAGVAWQNNIALEDLRNKAGLVSAGDMNGFAGDRLLRKLGAMHPVGEGYGSSLLAEAKNKVPISGPINAERLRRFMKMKAMPKNENERSRCPHRKAYGQTAKIS
ncbi:opacity protein-like surface antigen [Bradyrhizobium sp. LM2.7]